jgi:catalase
VFTFLLDDAGIPLNYRHMPGFGVNTFRLVNQSGKETYVKFHWLPKLGEKNLMDDDAVIVGGKNHSHATADLFEAIEKGDFPEWQFAIQTMEPEQEDSFDFDPLDDTKIWPEEQFPLQPVGRLVLNQNPDNFFNENEVMAFNPASIVPGILFSEDKVLQSRIFSYADTQRYRLGTNYLQLPINAPKCPFHNNHYDGSMNMVQRKEEIDYFPSRHPGTVHAQPYPQNTKHLEGKREKKMISKENNFAQVLDLLLA